jgi:hypothetical protein
MHYSGACFNLLAKTFLLPITASVMTASEVPISGEHSYSALALKNPIFISIQIAH